MSTQARATGQLAVAILAATTFTATIVESAQAGIGFHVERLTNINDEPGGDSFRVAYNVPNALRFAEFDGELYFPAYSPDTGIELYMTDGTNVSLVADVNPGPVDGFLYASPFAFQQYAGDLYFAASGVNDQGDPVGYELHRVNHQTGQVELVYDANPGPGTGIAGGDASDEKRIFNGKLYFNANNRLYSTDGTTTTPVDLGGDGLTTPYIGGELNGELYFSAYRPSLGVRRMYHTDGTTVSEVPAVFADGTPLPGNSYMVTTRQEPYAAYDGRIYFEGFAGTNSDPTWGELYSTDGTNIEIEEVFPGGGNNLAFPHNYKTVGDKLLFIARGQADGVNTGYEPYTYDAATDTVALLGGHDSPRDGMSERYPYGFDPFPEFGGQTYLTKSDGLFTTDGDTLTPVPHSGKVPIAEIGDTVFFRHDRLSNSGLVAYDGTTESVMDYTDTGGQYSDGIASDFPEVYHDLLFTEGYSDVDGAGLFVTDGQTIHPIGGGVSTLRSGPMTVFDDELIFMGSKDEGYELYTLTIVPLEGDANNDGRVDGLDYLDWAMNFGTTTTDGMAGGDFNGDGMVDTDDYAVWLENFGQTGLPSPQVPVASVPEPTALATLLLAMTAICCTPRRTSGG